LVCLRSPRKPDDRFPSGRLFARTRHWTEDDLRTTVSSEVGHPKGLSSRVLFGRSL